MAAPVSPAAAILMELGWNEAKAKEVVAKGKMSFSGSSDITDTSVVALAEHWPGLKMIRLWGCSNITDKSVVALAEQCPGLKEIWLDECSNITDTSVVALAERCAGLTKITLIDCSNITDTSVVALVEHCPELTKIDLWGCSITATAEQLLRDSLFEYDSDDGCSYRDESDCCVVDDEAMSVCKAPVNI